MKPLVLTLLFLASACLQAADWPASFEQYEKVALRDPNADEPLHQLRTYAGGGGRLAELKERWETLATGADEWRYRLLLAQCAVLAVDVPAARAELQKVTTLAPPNAETWLALGKFEMWQGTPEAQPALEKARALATDPSRAIVMMVTDHLDRGRKAEALAVLERRWSEVRDPAIMTRLLESWGKAAFAEGRLAQALALLEGTPGADSAGAIAGLYASVKDYAMAAAVLGKARAACPADAGLRERALAVARAAGDSSEALRLVREAAQADGSPARQCDLLVELIKNGVVDEAGRLLDAHPAELAGQAARWRGVLPEALQLGLGGRLEAALASAPEVWEAVFTRGELALIEGRYPQARALFWSLFEPRFERQPFSSQAPDRFNRFPGYYLYNVYAHLLVGDRYYHVGSLFYSMSDLLRQQERRVDSPLSILISPQDARDFSLCLLGIIAAETKTEGTLQQELAARLPQWPEDDRLFGALAVGTAQGIVTAIEAYAAGTQRTSVTDRVCTERLRAVETSADTEATLVPRARALAARLAASPPPPVFYRAAGAPRGRTRKAEPYRPAFDEFVKGHFTEALNLFYAAVRETGDSGAPLTSYKTDFALTVGQHRGSPARLAEAGATALACLFPPTYQRPKVEHPPESADLWAPSQPGTSSSFSYARASGAVLWVHDLPKETQPKLAYPPASLLSWSETGNLWRIFGETREPAVWAELKQRLDAPPAPAFPARVARSYLAWWNGEYEDAISRMRELLTESGDDGVRLGLAVMLLREGDRAGATALLDEMKMPYPAFARVRKSWALRMAAQAKDKEAVTALAGEIADAPFDAEQRRALAAALRSGGFPEEAERFSEAQWAALEHEEDWRRIGEGVRNFGVGQPSDAAVALARRVLAVSPRLAKTETLSQRYRGGAISVIRAAGNEVYQAYLEELQEGTAGDPIERQWRIAEVMQWGEAGNAAWWRLLELDPENVLAAERLVNQPRPGDPDRWRLFDALLARSPERLMQSRSAEIVPAYLAAGQLPKLLARLATARFAGPVSRQMGANEDDQWRRMATALAQAGEHDAAIVVIRKALTLTDAPPGALQRLLVQELDRAGHREELGRELLAMLAPEAPAPTPFLILESRGRSRSQLGLAGPPVGFDPEVLALAQKAGVADEARTRLAQAAVASPAARRSLLLLRALERDPALLPELEALGGGPLRPEEQPWLMTLAEALSTWPEAAASCRQLAEKLEPLLPARERDGASRLALARLAFRCGAQPLAQKLARQAKDAAVAENRLTQNGRSLRAVAELARDTGDAPLLADCAGEYVAWLGRLQPGIMNGRTEVLRALEIYVDEKETANAEKIIAAARQQAGPKRNDQLEESIQRYVDELHARAGDFSGHAPIVWLDSDRTTEKTATLIWDLALHHADDKQGRFSVTDHEVPGLAAKYDVELFFGETPDALNSLARFPKAGIRGEWKGALPASFGFVRAIFTRGAEILTGPILPVCAGRNLLKNEAAPGNRFPPGVPLPARGGPSPGGSAISYRDPNAAYAGAGAALSARRAAVEPGHDYALAGWLRAIGDRALHLTWRYLDQDGHELGTGSVRDYDSNPRYWSYHWVRLSWAPDRGHGLLQLPEGTAFIEPSIGGGADGFDLAGFYLIEVPETRARQE